MVGYYFVLDEKVAVLERYKAENFITFLRAKYGHDKEIFKKGGLSVRMRQLNAYGRGRNNYGKLYVSEVLYVEANDMVIAVGSEKGITKEMKIKFIAEVKNTFGIDLMDKK